MTFDQIEYTRQAASEDVASPLRNEFLTRAPKDLVAAKKDVSDKKSADTKDTDTKPTPTTSASQAFEEFQKTGKLTPELKKQFEDAVTESDKGPSPRVAELEKSVGDLKKKLDGLLTPDVKKEFNTLKTDMKAEFDKLPDEAKQQVAVLVQFRNMAEGDQRKQIDDAIKQLAPGVADKLEKVDKLLAPIIPVSQELQKATVELASEKQAPSLTRILYGVALYNSGDTAGAKAQIETAAKITPELLDDEDFANLAKQVGIDVEALKKK